MFKLLTILSMSLLLVACRAEPEPIDDGIRYTYFAMEQHDPHGDWQNFILIEVDSQENITAIQLDGVNAILSSTRRDLSHLELHEDDTEDYAFSEHIADFEESLIGQPVAELTALIQDGDTDGFMPSAWTMLAITALSSDPVERGPYLNGLYQSTADEPVDGFYHFVNFIVVHGHIVAVQWNAITEDGFLKYDYVTMTGVGAGSEVRAWRDQAILLEDALLDIQDPLLLTFDENGYATDLEDVEIEIETFVSLVIRGLAYGPITIELD